MKFVFIPPECTAAREEVDERLTTLENFEFDAEGEAMDEEIDALTNLLCAFHTG
jgi:hypothetical protein